MSSIKITVPSKIVSRIIYTMQLQVMAITIKPPVLQVCKNSSNFKLTSPEISLNINIKSNLIPLEFKLSNLVMVSLIYFAIYLFWDNKNELDNLDTGHPFGWNHNKSSLGLDLMP